ncbi:MAG: RNA-binding cell elongation regulator Jag/EloR [Candidatus Limnocylindrus sp.]|jgi:spoIIIJ-associated protein
MASESAYQEFTGKSVEEALKIACESFKVGLADLDFEIIAPGSKGVLGMGAEPARIVAAPASAIAGSTPKRATEAAPRAAAPRDASPRESAPRPSRSARPERAASARAERPARAARPERAERPERPERAARDASETREPRERRERSETTPEMIAGGKEILETLIKHLDFEAEVRLSGEGSETVLNVAGTSPEAAEELGSLIGRRGERLQAIQHLVNLMLSRKLGEWARVTVDIEEYRGRREAQLRALARKAGERVRETGRAVQLEPMTALERRWVHMELQGAPGIATESAGEEPERRVVVIPA